MKKINKMKGILKNKKDIRFWSKFTDEEILLALMFVTPEDKIITEEDLKGAECFIKTHKNFRDDVKKALENTLNK